MYLKLYAFCSQLLFYRTTHFHIIFTLHIKVLYLYLFFNKIKSGSYYFVKNLDEYIRITQINIFNTICFRQIRIHLLIVFSEKSKLSVSMYLILDDRIFENLYLTRYVLNNKNLKLELNNKNLKTKI